MGQRMMWIAWPAFLVAAVLEMLVFAFVNPAELSWNGEHLQLSNQSIYTLAFFAFWGLAMVSSGLTTLLAQSPFEINRCPYGRDERPADCSAK